MPIQVNPSGPALAEIMVVGEAPGAEEERQGIPFVGPSGYELDRMLHEVGITRSLCFITNVCRERPLNNDIDNFIAQTKKEITKEHTQYRGKWVKPQIIHGAELLKKEIFLVKPKMIIALGNTAMWALTGNWGVTKWRGSMLYEDVSGTRIRCIPTYHPAMILRQWEFRAAAIHDLRRAAAYIRKPYPDPGWQFRVRPSYAEVLAALEMLESLARKRAADRRASAEEGKAASEPGKEKKRAAEPGFEISFDLETRHGHIACAGLSWTLQDALCIPFMCVERREGYWQDWEEAEIVWRLYKLLTHPEVTVVGQNLLYDCQYTFRHWMFVPSQVRDTMIAHHVCYAGLPKKLDFQASMYCEHYVQWKPDRGQWKAGG